MTNNDKQQTKINDIQQQTTNNDQRQTTNDKQDYFLNAYHESWPPWYLDQLDYSDQLNHSDNPDRPMINQKANRRICIVYLVLFCVVFVNSINISTNIERAMLPNFSLFCEFEKKDWQHFSSRFRCFRHFDFLSLAPGFLPHSDVAPPGWAPFAKSERDVWKRILWHMSLLPPFQTLTLFEELC